MPETKLGPDPDNVWQAKSGFGGTDLLLAGVFSEGTKRGLTPNRVAELVSWNPSRRFGLLNKGDITPGYDADIALVDPDPTHPLRKGMRASVRIDATEDVASDGGSTADGS